MSQSGRKIEKLPTYKENRTPKWTRNDWIFETYPELHGSTNLLGHHRKTKYSYSASGASRTKVCFFFVACWLTSRDPPNDRKTDNLMWLLAFKPKNKYCDFCSFMGTLNCPCLFLVIFDFTIRISQFPVFKLWKCSLVNFEASSQQV